jgi:hypothetical protein
VSLGRPGAAAAFGIAVTYFSLHLVGEAVTSRDRFLPGSPLAKFVALADRQQGQRSVRSCASQRVTP